MEHIFTFGYGHECPCGLELRNCYTVMEGDWAESRARMAETWGVRWSHQYETKTAAGVEEYGLVEIITNTTNTDRCPCGRTSYAVVAEDGVPALLWFGEPWGAAICALTDKIRTPVGSLCFMCEKPIYAQDQGFMVPHMDGQFVRRHPWHRRCMAESILGPGKSTEI